MHLLLCKAHKKGTGYARSISVGVTQSHRLASGRHKGTGFAQGNAPSTNPVPTAAGDVDRQEESTMLRYGFTIRTRMGQRVENVSIIAASQIDAERRLRKMYVQCEILECRERSIPAQSRQQCVRACQASAT